MRASSQRREAADGPLMALVNVVRECASPEETTSGRERGGGWSSPYYIRVAKNTYLREWIGSPLGPGGCCVLLRLRLIFLGLLRLATLLHWGLPLCALPTPPYALK